MKQIGLLLSMLQLLVIIPLTTTLWTRPQNHYSQQHSYKPAVSSEVSKGIKQMLQQIQNINAFTDKKFAQDLLSDLNQVDDSKRKLSKIDDVSATQLFALFKIHNPGCDTNKDNVIDGDQLKCLNIIWKSYVPITN